MNKNNTEEFMEYNWNRPLLPRTVICSNFNTFDGEKKVGLFVVLYDEQSDPNVIDDKNVIAIKLSTQNSCMSNYSVAIDTNLNMFFNDNCIACCSKIHTLHKRDQVYKILGIIHPSTYHRIYKTYVKFANEINIQLLSNL